MPCDQSVISHTLHLTWLYVRCYISDKLLSLKYPYVCINSGIYSQYTVNGHGWNAKTYIS